MGYKERLVTPATMLELQQIFLARLDEHIAATLEARLKAKSYRRFQVGATALACCESGNHRLAVSSANWKVHKGGKLEDGTKRCAEMCCLDIIRAEQHLVAIPGIVVSGPPQPDESLARTLHPCEDCQRMMRGSLYFYPETLIVCVDPFDISNREQFTLEGLFACYPNGVFIPPANDPFYHGVGIS